MHPPCRVEWQPTVVCVGPRMSIPSDPSSASTVSERHQSIDIEVSRSSPIRSLKNMSTNAIMLLLRKMLGQIIHDGRLTVIAPNGGVHHIGNGTPSITIRIVDPAVIPRLLLNPDLALGEAYMDGALLVDDGDIYGFLDLCFSNLGLGTGQGVRHARASLSRLVRRFCSAQSHPSRTCKRRAPLRPLGHTLRAISGRRPSVFLCVLRF